MIYSCWSKLLSVSSVLWPSMNSSKRGMSADVFLNGCNRKCPGCHNPELQEFQQPNVSVDDLSRAITVHNIKVITFMGGEPLDHPIESVTYVIKSLKHRFPELLVALYTSRELSEIDKELLELLDDIKTGFYDEARLTPRGSFLASTNQGYYQKQDTEWVELT